MCVGRKHLGLTGCMTCTLQDVRRLTYQGMTDVMSPCRTQTAHGVVPSAENWPVPPGRADLQGLRLGRARGILGGQPCLPSKERWQMPESEVLGRLVSAIFLQKERH